jgi:hypothetical protein
MLLRSAFLAVLVGAAAQYFLSRSQAQPPAQCAPAIIQAGPSWRDSGASVMRPEVDDIQPGRDLGAIEGILRQIAIYYDNGNRDGAEILLQRIRGLGTSDDKIEEALIWTRLHDGASRSQSDASQKACAF